MHPILLKIGPFTLYSYGFFVATAFLVSSALILREASKAGMKRESVLDVLIALLLGGLIGGRVLFVAINLDQYLAGPLHVFMLNEGGMAFHGGLAGGILGVFLACRAKRMSFWGMLDLVSPYAALGHAIGRIGCFMNGCCYGKPAISGPGVVFPGELAARIPTQIYESALLVILFVSLKGVWRKRNFDGQVFSAYIMLYALLRFAMEFLRGDNPEIVSGLTLPQIISIGMLVFGAGLWFTLGGRSKK